MIHTIVIAVLVYAAVKAALRKLRAPKPYKMQLVSRPEGLRFAARESGSTNTFSMSEFHDKLHDAREAADAVRSAAYWAGIMKRREQFERSLK